MRFPWTIWRCTSAELWRLVLLTAAVVIVVVAFAATIKPLADGKLGAAEALRLMLVAIIPMSQYALPFAAGFGATLAYHRLASDNELAAARASGISPASLLVPALAGGAAMAVLMSLLAGQVAPRYLRAMEEIITEDATRIIVNTIDRGESLVLNNLQVYADRVDRLGPDPDGGASERLLLTRVAAVQTDDEGNVSAEVTARRALVWLERVEPEAGREAGFTRVTLRLDECWMLRPGEFYAYNDALPLAVVVSGALSDDVKFLTDDELRRLPRDPDRLNVISSRRRNLAFHLARADTLATLRSELQEQRRVRFVDAAGQSLLVRAAGVRVEDGEWVLTPTGDGRVTVDVRREGEVAPSRTYSAESARLSADMGRDMNSRQLMLSLNLEGVEARGAGASPPTERKSIQFGELQAYLNPLPALLDKSSSQLLADSQARLDAGAGPTIRDAHHDLSRRLKRLWREVLARRHERWAMSASVLVMVMTGAVTAVRLKGRLPLTVYLWSFFPALLAVITVNAGQEATRSIGPAGLVMLWGGVVALGAYALLTYRSTRRH